MLLHLDADREQAWLVSIPRETRVTVPGHGEYRIDAACALGGPALFVKTFERLTRLPVDHVALIDRTGFRRLTDGVGGVPLNLDPHGAADPDSHLGRLALEMSGAMALDYVSEPRPATSHDQEHIEREHRFLRALLARVLERGTLADPPALRDLAASLGASVRVDAGLDAETLRTLLDSTSHLRPEDVTFLVAPVHATGASGGAAAVVRPDAAACAQLWDALAHDEMPSLVAAHPSDLGGHGALSAGDAVGFGGRVPAHDRRMSRREESAGTKWTPTSPTCSCRATRRFTAALAESEKAGLPRSRCRPRRDDCSSCSRARCAPGRSSRSARSAATARRARARTRSRAAAW
jgi:LCP family protein required for cell wall assembly